MIYGRKFWQTLDKSLFGWSIIIGIVLTALGEYAPFIHRVTSVILLLILINGGYAIYSGIRITKQRLGWWKLFVFPVCYLIGAYLYLPKYTYYFALVYLGVAYLSYSMTKQQA